MQQQSIFTSTHRVGLESLCAKLSERIGREVAIDYGTTDDNHFHDATFLLQDGACDPLVTIIAVEGMNGPGFAVMAVDGSSVAHDVTFSVALRSAQKAGALCARRNRLMNWATL